MKKTIVSILLACVLTVLTACSANLTEKSDVVSLFEKNRGEFLKAAESGDFSSVEKLSGVQGVSVTDSCTDVSCGGAGMGPSTHYYGIFYSAADDLCAVDVAGPADELTADGAGWLYQESGGDNRYYVEPLGDHFFYYEAHF